MQYCASARCSRITDITSVIFRVITSAYISSISCPQAQRSAEDVAETGEIGSPFSILEYVINVWLLYNSHVTRITVDTHISLNAHVIFIIDEIHAWHRPMTCYVREIFRWYSHRCTIQLSQVVSGQRLCPRKIYANSLAIC